ncbi:MAG TPA: LamG domain-containing protein [Anaerolineae bacterium]|nr:LamG domain-containing protein [Anaerolineae bacterium]
MKPHVTLNRLFRGLLIVAVLAGLYAVTSTGSVQADAHAGNALYFNSNQQYGHFGNDPSLNAATSIRTMEAWVKFHDLSMSTPADVQQEIVAKACGTSGMEIGLSYGDLNVYVSGTGGGSPASYPTLNLQTERWYHLAATHSGPGSTITLYVDGVPVATGIAAPVILDSADDPDPDPFSLCHDPYHQEMRVASWGGGGQFLNGDVDEVRIWNTTRTGDQIRANMYRELTGGETGLVGYYPMNETSGTTVPDRSTTVKSLPVTNGGSGYLTIPTVTVSGGDGSGAAGVVAAMRVDSVTSITGTGYTVNDVLTASGGTFSAPAVFTVTGVTAGVITSVVISNTGAYSALPANSVSMTGGSGTGAAFSLDWAVRSLQLTSAGSGYINTPPTVTFSSGNAVATANIHNDGGLYVPPPPLLLPAAWVTSGAFYGPRHALAFDGVANYVSANTPLTSIGPSGNFTFMAWVRPNATGLQDVLSFGSANSAEAAELRLNSLNQLEYGRNPAAWQSVTGVSSIGTGTWTHVAVVQSGANVQLYVNGVPEGSGTINSTTNFTNLYLGTRRYSGANDQFFNGQLDEVSVWNTALSAAQVQDYMNRSLAGDEAGLVSYYRMDYGTANGNNGDTGLHAAFTTLYDITANGNNGTLNNFALTGTASNWVDSTAFNTWVGSHDTDWTNPSNWSRGAAPVATDNLLILSYTGGNSPVITSTVAANHVAIGTGGSLTISGANALNVGGNWINNGSLTANSSLVTFGGGVTHELVLNNATAFNNLTVNSSDVLNEVVSADNATVGGTLTNNGIIRKAQSISATGARTFGLTGVAININTLGNLSRLTIDRVDANHPNASNAAMQTGRYWRITRALSGGTTEGQLDLTLPYAAASTNSKACRWVNGTGAGFDCGQATDNNVVANTSVTRLNYATADWAAQGTNFDLWTVGSNVNPTAVKVNELRAVDTAQAPYGWLVLVLVIGGGSALLLSLRRRKA